MPHVMTRDEIDVVSAQGVELYAYTGKASAGKGWPAQLLHNQQMWEFEACWNLPTQMKTYTQAARYFLVVP